jgi:preprotein translocase subunit SecY
VARLWRLIDRRALVITALCLVVWRLLDQIPVSDVTHVFITARLQNLGGLGFFAAIGPNSIPLSAYSIGAEGIGPYVEAMVLMSLAPVLSKRVRDMFGRPDGRRRIARWIRALAFLLAAGQAYGLTVLYQNTNPAAFAPLDWSARLAVCLALAGGTAVTILLADAIDEFGLGFGYGALILYVLGYVSTEMHRIVGDLASAPSAEAMLRPLALWAAFTIGVTVAGVAVLRAVRHIPAPREEGAKRPAPIELRLVMSGVLRPPQFAFAVLFLPVLTANYFLQSHAYAVQWFVANWGPYGPSRWLDAAYLILEASCIVFFAVVVAAIDLMYVPAPAIARGHATRLAVIGGAALALLVVAAPLAYHLLTQTAGTVISFSGFDIVLVVAVVLMTVRAIEGHKTQVPFTVSPSGLP